MFIDSCKTKSKSNGKTYVRHLLRESYREDGKVKHRTLANLSSASDLEIRAIKLALKNKNHLESLGNINKDIDVRQGLSVGAVATLQQVAKRIGITKALGASEDGKRALWQVLARVIDQGSRLSAVRLATSHAACDVLGLDAFDEDDLYENLDWLDENQASIEDRLFRFRYDKKKPELYLYDVTSSYFEGTCNELAAFGYNRDRKRGKMQVVYGLLCDTEGQPVSISAFDGNTTDTKTFGLQVHKVAQRFGGGSVTFVGDRGMIKGPQIEQLKEEKDHEFHYITAITKPQIETLLKQKVIQLGLFDEQLAEVTIDTGVRYVLRRNPTRAAEMLTSRLSRYAAIEQFAEEQNTYLSEHPRASVAVAQRKIKAKRDKLKLPKIDVVIEAAKTEQAKPEESPSTEAPTTAVTEAPPEVTPTGDTKTLGRTILLTKQQESWEEAAKLDGCYCLKSDLSEKAASKDEIHDRYKGLSQVEWAFRTSKTTHLEARPIYVRKASRTRGHLLALMLGYLLVQELSQCWRSLDLTVEEGLDELKTLCTTQVVVKGKPLLHNIPQPRESVAILLDAAKVKMPRKLGSRGVTVSTRKKLTAERKTA